MTERTNEIKRTVVNNRDIPILADVLPAMQAVRQIERRRQWQRDRMTAITTHLTGMPNGKGGEKGLDGALALLSELDQEHEARCVEYVRYIRAAQKVLNRIESVSMRVFVVMKYMLDMKDTEIMREMNMTRAGLRQARLCVEKARNMASVRWRERYILGRLNDY